MEKSRPRRLIGVLGTNTEVGKTYVATQWLSYLRSQELSVCARKPVQSYDDSEVSTDAMHLARATGERELDVCPAHRSYPVALAPPMAADCLGLTRISLADLVDEIEWPHDVEIGLVETVGGPFSPISHDGDSIDLLQQLQPDSVVLVAHAGLGVLNLVRLVLAHTTTFETTVFLNRYDPANELHRLNRKWLVERYCNSVATDVRELSKEIGLAS